MRTLHIVGTTAVPPPLIERGVELDALRAAVRAGSGVVILEAAAGLGKSALLEHGAAFAAEAGFQVRRGPPRPPPRPPPPPGGRVPPPPPGPAPPPPPVR